MMVSLQLSAISRQWEEFYHLPGIDWPSPSLRGHHQAFDGPFARSSRSRTSRVTAWLLNTNVKEY